MKHTSKNYLVAPAPSEHPTFNPSGNAFDAVAENRFTYGKAKAKEWDCDATLLPNRTATRLPASLDKRSQGSHVFGWTPKVADVTKVTRQLGSRVAVSQSDRETKLFRVTVKDKATGEDKSILTKLVTTNISVLAYGVIVIFTKTNRAKGTYHDSRDNARHPISFAKTELVRLLGVTEGLAKFAELIALPPKRTATQIPTTVQTGSTVAGS